MNSGKDGGRDGGGDGVLNSNHWGTGRERKAGDLGEMGFSGSPWHPLESCYLLKGKLEYLSLALSFPITSNFGGYLETPHTYPNIRRHQWMFLNGDFFSF